MIGTLTLLLQQNRCLIRHGQHTNREREIHPYLLALLRVSTIEPLADAPVLSTAEQLDRLLCCGVTAMHGAFRASIESCSGRCPH
jgi:hypothetical protein